MERAFEKSVNYKQSFRKSKINSKSTTNFQSQSKKTIEITKSTKQIQANLESTIKKHLEQHSTILRNEIQDSQNFL